LTREPALEQAQAFIDAALENRKREDASKGDLNWLVPIIVRREAKSLIDIPAPPSKKQDSN